MTLRGCGTALITPFKADGSIDEPALRSFVEWQITEGIHFLVPCGTTGETPTLTQAEWLRVIDITIEVANKRVPVVAGATSNNTAEAIEKAKLVAARPGVDYILTATPYYNKPTAEGQYQHFKAIAEAVEKPLILYNIPGRTGANIEPATLVRLAQIKNIVAVKESSGSIPQIAEVLNSVPTDFTVIAGDDDMSLPVVAMGARGLISVASNLIPREMSQLLDAALRDDGTSARQLYHKYLPLIKAIFSETSPMPVKAVLAMMGKLEERYRLPMVPVKPETKTKLQKMATDFGLIKS